MGKCVLAFSGSLESLCSIAWLKERYDMSLVALSLNLGGEPDLPLLGEQALEAGATVARIEDLRESFFADFIGPSLKAMAHYQSYLLASALSRPLIAREMVRVALEEGASTVVHAASLEGNDQVRLESAIRTLAPHLRVLSTQHEWDLHTHEKRIEYAKSRRLPVPAPQEDAAPFCKYDRNLWGQSIHCAHWDDLNSQPPESSYTLTRSLRHATDDPEEVRLEFRNGLPIGLNGQRQPPVALIEQLNQLVGKHGIGRSDVIEDRLVGFKSREIYEAPAAAVITQAKRALEQITLSRDVLQVRDGLSVAYGRCVYNGQWFSGLREALDAFFCRVNENVTGEVALTLYKGNLLVTGRKSDFSLFEEEREEGGRLDPASARGFTYVWSMPLSAEARRKKP
jgi:argininosuccinate synthase